MPLSGNVTSKSSLLLVVAVFAGEYGTVGLEGGDVVEIYEGEGDRYDREELEGFGKGRV